MKEAFLQFIWQFQLFNKQDLTLFTGEAINIIKPGSLNSDSGPDFSQGHINYDDLDFYGHIEIHLKSSEWYNHKHHEDSAYNNVILHVVLENDREAKTQAGHAIPTIELRGRIPLNFYQNYEKLINSQNEIPCESQIQNINQVVLISMLDRVLMERLEQKSQSFTKMHNDLNGDWEEAAFRIILKSFGFKRNKDGFSDLASVLFFKDIKRYAKDLTDIEAILFGTAGFLKGERKNDDYFNELKERYKLLKNKFSNHTELDPVVWKFFRLRPGNFPTLRIAQFSAFILKKEHLLSRILEMESLADVKNFFKDEPSSYWQKHYKFSNETEKGISKIGESSVESLIINAVIPIWVSYSKMRRDESYMDKALKILEELSAENNKITRFWKNYSFPNNNAFDSQALIQLYNNYCSERKCLKCNIGVSIVREY